jgi:uncharacterized Zn finger protein (UPF0148 family)
MSEQQIKFMVGWAKDSSQFERYSHVQDREVLNDINAEYNLGESEIDVGATFTNCPSCDAGLSEWVNPVACPACGIELSHAARETREKMDDDIYEDAKEVTDAELQEALDVFRRYKSENPDVLDDVTG